MYHHVAAHAAAGPYGLALTVTPREFDAQLRLLRQRGCAAVGVTELVRDVQMNRVRACEVALTFDDGYDDAATEAAPLLQRHGDVATFFVTTGFLGTSGHLSKSQVRSLAQQGMEIGAHTVTHADLTTLSAAQASDEVGRSRRSLQGLTNQPIAAFAYPAGRYNAVAETAVRDAGFSLAVSTDAGRLTSAALARDMYALPRFRILRKGGEALIASALSAARAGGPRTPDGALRNIARSRIEGNDPDIAERVAVALLRASFPEQILKVRVMKTRPAAVAGIMISGVKFHGRMDRPTFAADASEMVARAFEADQAVSEVDVWAVVPVAVDPSATVSGDLAVPTTRTVFSASVMRAQWVRDPAGLGATYWDPSWQLEQI
jgi:peptidoglycan/xylan/chitin deacetylase (PgdA/CDA1 family)